MIKGVENQRLFYFNNMVKIISAKPKPRQSTFREIYEKRKKVLIKRDLGGLGDILMHRMLFEDFKMLIPDLEITFACPQIYHQAVIDHPFIDIVADCKAVNEENYALHYVTSSVCARYELRTAPHGDKSRPDIWAEHCGVNLTRHNMHIRLTEQERAWGKSKLTSDKPVVLISPISAMLSKNLAPEQINPVIAELTRRGYYVLLLHNTPVNMDAPCLYGMNIRNWMSVIDAADYIISVDTATFHCAGGMGKPVVGVYGWADSHLYGRYYPTAVLVQKHRDYTPGWTCGPCYDYGKCPMCPSQTIRKPCITGISHEDILKGFNKLVAKYSYAKIE